MSAKFVRLTLMVCLLFCILGCLGLPVTNPNSRPVRSIRVTMDVKQRKELFNQLKQFADAHSLRYILNLSDPQGKSFLAEMHGNGFHITAGGDDNAKNEIGFYNEKATPTSPQTIDQLFTNLKGFLRKIPNATVADQKSLSILADPKQKDKIFVMFFARLKTFADQHALKFTMSSTASPDQSIKNALVEMVGDNGFHLTIQAVTDSPKSIDVDFFIDVTDVNSAPASQKTVDELFKDINSFLADYDNVTVTQQP
jgi:hypothetical protein